MLCSCGTIRLCGSCAGCLDLVYGSVCKLCCGAFAECELALENYLHWGLGVIVQECRRVRLLGRHVHRRKVILGGQILGMSNFLGRRVSPRLFGTVNGRVTSHCHSTNMRHVIAVRTSNVTLTLVTTLRLSIPLMFTHGGGSVLVMSSMCRDIICSCAGRRGCSVAVSGGFLPTNRGILVVSSFLTSNRTTVNLTGLIRSTNSRIMKVTVTVRGSFRPNHRHLRGTNCHMRSLIHVGRFGSGNYIFVRSWLI